MGAYLKGGLLAFGVALACIVWYETHQDALPVNQSPMKFQLINKWEREGIPDFHLKKLDGKPVELADYRGKILILNFWASWCNPCVEEFPSMMKLVEGLGGDVVVLAVTSEDSRADIDSFVKIFGLPKPAFDVAVDPGKALMQEYGVEQLPESFIVGRDGKLLRKVTGSENWNTADAVEFFKDLAKKH